MEVKRIKNEKKNINEVKEFLKNHLSELPENSTERLEKNIVATMVDELEIGKSKAYADIKILLKDEQLIKKDEMIFYNSKNSLWKR